MKNPEVQRVQEEVLVRKSGLIRFLYFVSGCLLITGLYQLEMMWIQKAWEFGSFSMPFGFEVPFWFARDIWYLSIVLGFFILLMLPFVYGGRKRRVDLVGRSD